MAEALAAPRLPSLSLAVGAQLLVLLPHDERRAFVQGVILPRFDPATVEALVRSLPPQSARLFRELVERVERWE